MAKQVINNGETLLNVRNKLNDNFTDLYNNKVDKDGVKVLSTNDYTTVEKNKLDNITTITKDPTGFIDGDNLVLSYDSTARTVTLTHSSGNIEYLWRGVKKTLISPWTSAPHTDSNNSYFLKSSDGDNFTWSSPTPWNFEDIQVAYVYFNTNDKFALRETHGLMPYQTHREFHEAIGTYRVSGGDLGDISTGSTIATNRRPLVSACVVKDEDLISTVTAITNETNAYTILNLTGASTGTAVFTKASADIVPLNGNVPYYNQLSGGNYTQTPLPNNAYMNVWLVAVPVTNDVGSQSYRFLWLQGQTQSGTISTIQNESPRNLSLGNLRSLFSEFIFIGRVMIRYTASNWQIIETASLTGSQYSQVGSSAGSGLTSVSIDETLTGNGTNTNPLGVLSTVTNQTSASLTLDSTHNTILCNCTSNGITVNLPAVASAPIGRRYTIVKTDSTANTVVIDGNASETINGATTVIIQYFNSAITVMNNGTNWNII